MTEPGLGRTRRNTACVSCRDSKVKCDAYLAPKQPCSRCAKLQLECVVDKSHKRISRRNKLEELAQEVKSIKKAVSGAPDAGAATLTGFLPQQPALPTVTPVDPPLSVISSARRSLAERQPTLPLAQIPTVTPLVTATGRLPTEPRALKSRVFSAENIDFYFDKYFETFHPYLPIVRNRDPNHCYCSAPVLFWTIITTSCRHHAKDDTIFPFLISSLPSELWAAIADHPIPLGVVQALLLVTAWPLALRVIKDPSPTFASIAMNACFFLGLHTGEANNFEFTYPSYPLKATTEEAIFVWAGANILSQRVASYSGFPPTGPLFNRAIDRILDGSSSAGVSPHFRVQLEAAKFLNKLNKTTAACLEDASGVPHHMILLLEEEFENAHKPLVSDLADIDRFILFCTMLEIQAYYFMPLPDASPQILECNILRAYNTARAVIRTALALQDGELSYLSYAPHYVSRILLTAGCITFLVLSSPLLDASTTREAKDPAMHDAVRALRSCSALQGDLPSRISRLLDSYRSLSRVLPAVEIPQLLGVSSRSPASPQQQQQQQHQHHFTQRLAMSLTLECLRRWRGDIERLRPADVASFKPTEDNARVSGVGGSVGSQAIQMNPEAPFQMADWDSFMEDFDFDCNWDMTPGLSVPPS